MRLAALYLKAKRPDDAIKELLALHSVELHDNRYAKRIARIYRDENKNEPAIKYAIQSVYVDPYDMDAHELLADLYGRAADEAGAAHEHHVIDLLTALKERQKPD